MSWSAVIKRGMSKFKIALQLGHYGNTDLIYETSRWYPSLPVLKKKLAGAAAIPRGEPSGHPLASLASQSVSK